MYNKNAWEKYSDEEFKLVMKFNDDYKDFLSKGKATPFKGDKLFGKCVLTALNGKTVSTYKSNTELYFLPP